MKEWHGCWVEVWDYTASHGTLRLKLQHEGADGCCVLLMKSCDQVAFQPSWRDCAISVEPRDSDYVITDADRLNVVCGAVVLSSTLTSYVQIPKDALATLPVA